MPKKCALLANLLQKVLLLCTADIIPVQSNVSLPLWGAFSSFIKQKEKFSLSPPSSRDSLSLSLRSQREALRARPHSTQISVTYAVDAPGGGLGCDARGDTCVAKCGLGWLHPKQQLTEQSKTKIALVLKAPSEEESCCFCNETFSRALWSLATEGIKKGGCACSCLSIYHIHRGFNELKIFGVGKSWAQARADGGK